MRKQAGSMFAQQKDILHIFANLPSVNGLRSEWNYTNWSYAVAAYLIDKVSHLPWAEAVDDILGRLGLMRTYTNRTSDDNYARAYSMSSDSSANQSHQLHRMEVEDAFECSGSVRTCVTDMLRWCRLLIKASKPGTLDGKSSLSQKIHPVSIYSPETLTKERILNALWTIQQPDTPLEHDLGQQYAKGLYSFTLPTPRINTVTNDLDVTRSYVMGADSAPRTVIGHTGDLGSFTSAYWVFPETESAVVVLTNANSANGDPSNIVAQVLIQALFDLQPKIDYTKVAAEIVLNAILQWESAVSEWDSHRIRGTKPNHPNAYIGDYTNADLRMTLRVKRKPPSQSHHPQEERKMLFRINGIIEQTFELHHYHRDSWTFMPGSRDECLRLGLGIYIPCWQSFVLEFGPYDGGQCRWVRWRLDPDSRVASHVFGRVAEAVYAAA